MSNIVGIDLGTTLSSIAVLDQIGKPEIISNQDGENITPSVVYWDDEEQIMLVGTQARLALTADPDKGVEEVKKEMGQDSAWEWDGIAHNPEQISSYILKKLIQDAALIKGPIESAVVTVPANFANEARNATLKAGHLAGIEVSHIINEPTAAAVFYATQNTISGNLLVYDLGGGTFDATVARIGKQEVECIASQGDRNLGGKDFDRIIVEWMREKYKSQHGVDLVNEDVTEAELMTQAEEIKKVLSRRAKTRVRLQGPMGSITEELKREDFEEMISTKVARTESLVEIALDESGMSPEDIDYILLVGGSTRIPVFQESIRQMFGKEPTQSVNVDEVVAMGAAIYAGMKAPEENLNVSQKKAMGGIKMSDVCNSCYGVIIAREGPTNTPELVNETILQKNTPTPCSNKKSFYTIFEGQSEVKCTVTQSKTEEEDPQWVDIVWEGSLELPSGRPPGQEVEVTFSYSENETMNVRFRDVSSGKLVEGILDVSKAIGKGSGHEIVVE
ncbi:MAG: Hsp70 family protein [Opitutae bacterium]|nr:Hsp70 family protein [Opitutae bacterium]